jgi:ribonuclease VapC
MIVDSSALIAIVLKEPEAHAYTEALFGAVSPRMSAATYLECAIVIDGKRDPIASRRFDELLAGVGMIIEPVTAAQARLAREAYRDYGKGSGHPAGLNFGDCLAYALARDRGEPLLYKGTDFAETDLRPAVR